jgi:hypothetical protein
MCFGALGIIDKCSQSYYLLAGNDDGLFSSEVLFCETQPVFLIVVK